MRLPFSLTLAAVLALGAASPATCQSTPSAEQDHRALSSQNAAEIPSEWRDSKQTLVRDVLRFLQAEDLRALASITVNSEDYKTVVWPQLPISNPRNNIPFEYVFGRHNQISRGGLLIKVNDFKGKNFTVVKFTERPERDKYADIRIIPVGDVIVTDSEGKEFEVRLLGSILESKGRFKVFSYKTD